MLTTCRYENDTFNKITIKRKMMYIKLHLKVKIQKYIRLCIDACTYATTYKKTSYSDLLKP